MVLPKQGRYAKDNSNIIRWRRLLALAALPPSPPPPENHLKFKSSRIGRSATGQMARTVDTVLLFVTFCISVGPIRGEGLSCPAPRSPENGLSFLFNGGQVVKYSCHPGFTLVGHSQAECLRHIWSHPSPICRLSADGSIRRSPVMSGNEVQRSARPLFKWEGSDRLPLSNGLWNAVHKRNSSALVRQETKIADLREQQLRNVSEQRRQSLQDGSEWRRQQVATARQQPDTLYAPSRAASSRRHDTVKRLPPEEADLASGGQTRAPSDLRLKQISEVHRSRMGPSNGDKAGLVEAARRKQYEDAQTHIRRPVFSDEKSAQVETIYRNIVRGPVYGVAPPVLRPTLSPPPRRPVLAPITTARPPSGEKAAGESLLDQYLRAEHFRRILELERSGGRRSAVEERSRPAVDVEFLSRLSPELQERYLRELVVARGKEASDPAFSLQFLQRHGLSPPI